MRMHNELVKKMNIDEDVANYALLKVDFGGVDRAIDFIFGKDDTG